MARTAHELTPPAERAILIGAPRKGASAKHVVQEHLEELARLADTAGAIVVGTLTQQLDRPHAGTYLGKGKIEELTQLTTDKDATLIIFDDELSPAQGKSIEDAVGKRVMDRAELILDIFAVRARSAEAKMQVELAQLEYLLPRLTRMWTHLEKFRGGIGMRGPGETQLETDRRLIGHRLRTLKERLADVTRSRAVQRAGRKASFRTALVGYTNAGKSSVLRGLSGAADIVVEDRLFATLDPLTREVTIGVAGHVLVTDTVGFIRKLPHHLVASFRATLEEVTEANVLLHVIDASDLTWEEHREVVDEVLADLGVHDTPVVHVFNKMDLLPSEQAEALEARMSELLPGSVFVSALKPGGLESLRATLLTLQQASRPVQEFRVPAADGRTLAELHRSGEVVEQTTEDDVIVVRARVSAELAGRLRARLST